MRYKVSDVVYRRFNKHWMSKNLWNANPPNSAKRWNLDIKTSSPDTQESQIQMPECVNYSRKWLCLGNKYFLAKMYQYQYQYQRSKYKYKYQYPKIVLKYRSSTSTSTQYNKIDFYYSKLLTVLMWPALVSHPVRLSVTCLRFSRNKTVIETSSLVETWR